MLVQIHQYLKSERRNNVYNGSTSSTRASMKTPPYRAPYRRHVGNQLWALFYATAAFSRGFTSVGAETVKCSLGEYFVPAKSQNASTTLANIDGMSTRLTSNLTYASSVLVGGQTVQALGAGPSGDLRTMYTADGHTFRAGPSAAKQEFIADNKNSEGVARMLGIPVNSVSALVTSTAVAAEVTATTSWADLHTIKIPPPEGASNSRWLILAQWVERWPGNETESHNGALRLNCTRGCTGALEGKGGNYLKDSGIGWTFCASDISPWTCNQRRWHTHQC